MSQPPFNEGIALFGEVIDTNDTSFLRWHLESKEGLTLGQIPGIGLCLLGPQMLPPLPLFDMCNQILAPNLASKPLGPFVDILLLLSFGPWAFNRLTSFVKLQIDSALNKTGAVHYHRLDI